MTLDPPAPETAAWRRGRFSALRHRDFALLWGGLLVSNTGTWMQTVAQGWLIITLTDSPGWLGAVALARSVPYLIVPPMGGVLADRLDRIKLLKVTQTLSMLIAALLALLAAADLVTEWHLLALSFLAGATNAVDQPTRNALLPDIVPQRDLMNAISLNSVTFTGAALIGPAVAGFLVSVIGFAAVFFINAASYGAVLAALFVMRSPSRHERQATTLRRELVDGLRFVVRTRLVLGLLVLSGLFGIFARSYDTLLPAFARQVLHTDERWLGIMYSAPGFGTLAGGFVLAAAGDVRDKSRLLITGTLASAVLVGAFALSPSLAPALAILTAIGIAFTVYWATSLTLLQTSAPGRMRGRVMSYNTVALMGLTPLGGAISGFAAELLGVREAIFAGAAILGLAVVLLFALSPELRSQRRSGSSPV